MMTANVRSLQTSERKEQEHEEDSDDGSTFISKYFFFERFQVLMSSSPTDDIFWIKSVCFYLITFVFSTCIA